VLGVLAVFTHVRMDNQRLAWLRMLADHAATAIANARAFEEIEQLRRRLELENEYLREEVAVERSLGDMVGESAALRKVLRQVELVAPADTSVLILGESGVGKELVARAIHERSRRRDHPLVKVNCASIPRELFESEFFGHVRGAFTGAVRDRVGRFLLAERCPLFLDAIGEISIELQSKLLRVLQEGSFERIGDNATRSTDVRIIAATNRDLKAEMEARRFREDLYYRLSVFPIEVPPLRDRPDDVPALAAHFLEQTCRRLGYPALRLRRRHVEALRRHDWPGNVRELQNLIERAVITARRGRLELDLATTALPQAARAFSAAPDAPVLTYAELREQERRNLRAALDQTSGKVSGSGGAAELLGVKPTTLASRIKAMGIGKPAQPNRAGRVGSGGGAFSGAGRS